MDFFRIHLGKASLSLFPFLCRIFFLCTGTLQNKQITYPAFTGVTDLAFSTHEDTDFSAFDVVFLAVPHKAAMGMAPDLMAAGVTVVDLSADFRLKDPALYEKWYAPHTATDLLAQAAFGLPELKMCIRDSSGPQRCQYGVQRGHGCTFGQQSPQLAAAAFRSGARAFVRRAHSQRACRWHDGRAPADQSRALPRLYARHPGAVRN